MCEMREQMDALLKLVGEASQKDVGASTAKGLGEGHAVKLAKLTDQDDIEAYLVTFEIRSTVWIRRGGLSSWHLSCQGKPS